MKASALIGTRSRLGNQLLRSGAITFTLFLVTASANAQFTQTSTDGTTPLGLSPGAPAGSFPLSGFETVNPYNGNLNFALPLLGESGRGGARMTVVWKFDVKGWRVRHGETIDPNTGNPIDTYLPTPNWWTGYPVGYGPGILQGRQSGGGITYQCTRSNSAWGLTLTRLTFTLSDGTEYELRDQQTGGQPLTASNPCNYVPVSRGTVFITADGTAATFISDTAIYDRASRSGGGLIYPSGYLMLRDGTRYRIDGGNVTWLRDRNGNKLSFLYDANHRVTTITDSLNRQVTVTYADFTSTFSDQITYKGFGGAIRTISVNYTPLSSALRSGYSIQTYAQLFPELNGSTTTTYNPNVVSSITLPNNRQYQLQYNSYAELARVVLPTGGAIEYDYTPTSGAVTDGVDYQIYRRVVERRVYPDGSTLEGRITFGNNPSPITVDHLNPAGTLLAREKHYYLGDPSNSLFQDGATYPARADGREYQTDLFASDGTTVLRRVQNTWVNRAPVSWWSSPGAATEPPNDPRLADTTTTLEPVGANLVAKKIFGYDDSLPYNNRNDVKEYDYGNGVPGPLVRETRTTYITTTNYTDAIAGASLRSLPSQVSIYDAGGVERARASYEYDNYTPDTYHAALVDRPAISGLDSSFTTANTTRGNVTATTSYLLINGSVTGSITAYSQFDIAGNVWKAIDARGCATTFDFTDRFGTPNGNAQTNTPPTELSSAGQTSYTFATSVTNCLNQTAYVKFDYYLGRPVDGQDVNGVVASGYYNGPLDRPTQIIRDANNLAAKSQTSFSYDDVNRIITTTSDLTGYGDNALVSKLLFDGLGRTQETRRYEGGTNYISVQKQYDAMGRAYKASNPFRPWRSENPVWTTTAFDALSRMISVTTADGAVVTSSYTGNSVTSSDQLGKSRKSVSDALGRLTSVYEDPSGLNYQTTYAHGVLNELSTVTQGSQTRSFVYDSLKRLRSATNPENGTICYGTVVSGQCQANGYDSNGNLLYKTDARGVLTSISYDALNRPTSKTYSSDPSGTPPVNYFYDNQALPGGAPSFTRGASIGRLVAVTYGSGSAGDYYGFDAIGRGVLKIQQLGGINYQVSAAYNVSDRMTSETYPSGHSVTYNYDQAGRLADKDAQNLAFTGKLGDGATRTYAAGITYSDWGSLSQEQFGTQTAVYNKLFYNSSGQLAEIRESTTPTDTSWNRGAIINRYSNQCWGMCADASNPNPTTNRDGSNSTASMTDNNGNLKKQDVYVPANDQVTSYTSWYQQYTDDSLNRLTRVNEYTGNPASDWQQSYIIDRWSNRTIDVNNTSPNIPHPAFNVDTTTNRLAVPSGQSGAMGYDAAGNLNVDSYMSTGNRTFDAENRMTSAQGSPYWSYYTYDGVGHRVKRNINNQETWQVYGLGGALLAEYPASGSPSTPQKEYGYRNGGLLVTATNTRDVRWITTDQLGTPRMIFDSTGSLANVSRHDYLPFGEELGITQGLRTAAMGYTGSDAARQKFTAQERDGETGLDYMHARYCSSAQGRFTSPDTMVGSIANPQSLNRYAYVGNNPLNYSDPTGHIPTSNTIWSSSGINPGWGWNDGGHDLDELDRIAADIEQQIAAALQAWRQFSHFLPGLFASDSDEEGTGDDDDAAGTSDSGTGTGATDNPQNPSSDSAQNQQTDQNPQVTITYNNGVPAMQPKTQEYIEKIATAAGVESVNISATTNGRHARNSNHYNGTAVDINEVNGKRVINAGKDPSVAADVRSIQNAANSLEVGVAHENYGPAGLYKEGKQFTNRKLQSQHENHIHITIPRNTNDEN